MSSAMQCVEQGDGGGQTGSRGTVEGRQAAGGRGGQKDGLWGDSEVKTDIRG